MVNTDFDFTEVPVEQKTVFTGRIINVRTDTVRVCSGTLHGREVVEHNGGVCIVAVDNDRNVIMVTQYRYPVQQHLFEIPAGKLEKGEEPLSAAIRELSEETGFTAGSIVSLGEILPSPGFSSEKLYLYLATELSGGECHPDEDEFLKVEKYNLDTLVGMIMRNEIIDGKTVAGILKAKLYLDRV